MVDILAHDIGKDPAQLRMENFIQPEQFRTNRRPAGSTTGNYPAALQKAMDIIDYPGLRGADRRGARGEPWERHLLLHRDRRGRPVARLRHHRVEDERRLRDPSTRRQGVG
jgi:hypothetical protein